ncbi:hypothetical protein A7K50_12400 [Dehalobacter sp. MCB1]|uniref:phage terminase large subunit family protein n=1 Tax=Dehalobacter sp. MCB1 TaxID=1844756 RepID=UPI000E6BE4CD|nr:hypothetical protein [Dehalobacter sp. MCB1]RJE46819.1 hypothetical protein A7K50_12400 [Dehalobacter sp. MCB1]
MPKFYIGLDLGQANDYTALAVLERLGPEGDRKEAIYHVRHLERVRGIPYPEIVAKVAAMLESPALKGNTSTVIDMTGCGRPVFDMFKEAGLSPIGVQIHGGDRSTQENDNWRVPKRDLVAVLQVLLQAKRLKIASRLELGAILQAEMLNFRVKIDPATAHDSYSAWREADHDDLVLSVALAAWHGEHREPETTTISIGPGIGPRPYVSPVMGY